MKKFSIVACAMFAAFMMTACNSTDALVSRFERACENKNVAKATKIALKLEEKSDELTREQSIRISKAARNLPTLDLSE